jgi:predicted phosphodiesterase
VRYLVLSDVHANATALEAVLRDAERRGFDAYAFLGDAVGYYPDAEEVVQRLAGLAPAIALLGNHDELLLNLADGRGDANEGGRSPVVRPVLERQLAGLSPDSVAWLRSLRMHETTDLLEAVHGALAEPWQYLHGLPDAEENLPLLSRPVCMVGHTHVPRVLATVEAPDGRRLWRQMLFRDDGGTYRMPPRARGFVNPGSVGQPRDGVPLASYALYDADTRRLQVVRVAFDVMAVQRRVKEAGYPAALATRLAVGR